MKISNATAAHNPCFLLHDNQSLFQIYPILKSVNRRVLLICGKDVMVGLLGKGDYAVLRLDLNAIDTSAHLKYRDVLTGILEHLSPCCLVVVNDTKPKEQEALHVCSVLNIPSILISPCLSSSSALYTLHFDIDYEKYSHGLSQLNEFIPRFIANGDDIRPLLQQWNQLFSYDRTIAILHQINRLFPVDFTPVRGDGRFLLNLGCGHHPLPGWINTDINTRELGIQRMDAAGCYPFADESVDLIYSEHMFEHLTPQQQFDMLKECYRVLRHGGRMRLATPNLHSIMSICPHPDIDAHHRYLNWSFRHFIKPKLSETIEHKNFPIYVLNNFMHDWGHQMIHTPESIQAMVISLGFINPETFNPNESNIPEFMAIERHGSEIPEWANTIETFAIEFTKP